MASAKQVLACGLLCVAVVSAVQMYEFDQEEEFEQAVVCSPGAACSFTSSIRMEMDEKAASKRRTQGDRKKDMDLEIDFEIKANCPTSAHPNAFYRGVVTHVEGGSSKNAAQMMQYPFFFSQVGGKIGAVMTADKDPKPCKLIKRALARALAKKYKKSAVAEAASGEAQYDVQGTDENGNFDATHKVSMDVEGNLVLDEDINYLDTTQAVWGTERGGNRFDYHGQPMAVKSGKAARSKIGPNGNINKVKEVARVRFGSAKPLNRNSAEKIGDIGQSKFNIKFEIDRIDKEEVATCDDFASNMDLDDFRAHVDQQLEGSDECNLNEPYTQNDLVYDENADVPDQVLIAHAVGLIDDGAPDITLLRECMRPSTTQTIVDAAWKRYQTDRLDQEGMQNVLAALGTLDTEASFNELIETMKSPDVDPLLRSQAMMALHRSAEEPRTPKYVLDAVSDVAFGEEDMDISDQATLLLGTLANNNPDAEEHLQNLGQRLSAASGPERDLLVNAWNNAHSDGTGAIALENIEESEDPEVEDLLDEAIEEIDEPAPMEEDLRTPGVSDLQMGASGSYTLINKNKSLVGSSKGNFQINAKVLAQAKWGGLAASVKAHGGLHARLFKYRKPVIAADFNAQAAGYGIGANYKFTVIGLVVDSWTKNLKNKYVRLGGKCPTGLSAAPKVLGKTYSKDLISISVRFMAGPVPLKVSVGVAGSVGWEVRAGGWIMCASKKEVTLVGGAQGTGSLIAKAAAMVDAFVARAGVEGQLNIFSGKLPVYGIANTKGITGKVDLTLGALSGKISIFAEIGLAAEAEAEAEAYLQRSEAVVNNNIQVSGLSPPGAELEGSSPFVGEIQEHQRGWWRRVKRWGRRAVRFVRRVASRVVRYAKKGLKYAAKYAKKGLKYAYKGLKYVAKHLKKRWTKVILKWNGRSKTFNLFKVHKSYKLPFFFKSKKLDAKKATPKKTTPKKKTPAKKPTPKKKSQPKKQHPHHGAKKASAAARRAAQRTRDSMRRQNRRTRQAVRNTGRRARQVARNSGRRVAQAAKKSGQSASRTARHTAQRDRKLTRAASRRVKHQARTQAKRERHLARREVRRQRATSKANRRATRRNNRRIRHKLARLAAAQKRQRLRREMRRKNHAERHQMSRVKKQLRRQASRNRFRRLRRKERRDKQKIARALRRKKASQADAARFRRMRQQNRRSWARRQQASRYRHMRRVIRRTSGRRRRERRSFRRLRQRQSRARRNARKRRMMQRLNRRTRRRTAARRRLRLAFHGIRHRIHRMALAGRRIARRVRTRVVGGMRRAWLRARRRRQQRRTRLLMRRRQRRARARRRLLMLRRRNRLRFRRARMAKRRRQRRLRRGMRRNWRRSRNRRRQRRLRKMTRRTSRRQRRTTRRTSRRSRRRVRRQSRHRKAMGWLARIRKRLRRGAAAARRRARMMRKRARNRIRRGRRRLRTFAKRKARRARRSFRRITRGARRIGKRVMRGFRRF